LTPSELGAFLGPVEAAAILADSRHAELVAGLDTPVNVLDT
jgi:hypothetical protein